MADLEGELKASFSVNQKNKANSEVDKKSVSLDLEDLTNYNRSRGQLAALTSNVVIGIGELLSAPTLFITADMQIEATLSTATDQITLGATSGAPIIIGNSGTRRIAGISLTNMSLSSVANYDIFSANQHESI